MEVEVLLFGIILKKMEVALEKSEGEGRRQVMSKGEQRIVQSLSETLFPRERLQGVGTTPYDVVQEAQSMVGFLLPKPRLLIRLLLWLWECSPIMSWHWGLFSRMSLEKRSLHLTVLSRRRLCRRLIQFLKAFIGMAYFCHEGVLASIQYDGLPQDASKLGPLEKRSSVSVPAEKMGQTMETDVVVVGSGAGGATVASELAKAGFKVVVLEEGPEVTQEDYREKPAHRLMRFYRDGGFLTSFGNAIVLLPMGRTVGGTTVVNCGSCFRTPDFVLDSWGQSLGLKDLRPDGMMPLFEAIEQRLRVQPVAQHTLGKNGAILKRGAERLGVSHHPMRRPTVGCKGQGECAFLCPWEAKLDMRLTYLRDAVTLGAEVFSGCKVEKILSTRGRVWGVEATVNDAVDRPSGRRVVVKAPIVVLSAGAVFSPLLLLKSHLGNRRLIGRNLSIHPAYTVTALFDEPVVGWKGVMQSYVVDEWIKEGLLLEATFPPPSIEYASANFPFVGGRHHRFLERFRHVAEVGIMVSDTSTGRVRWGPLGHPWIWYSFDRRGIQRILRGIEKASEALFAAGAREVYSGLPGCEIANSQEEMKRFVNRRWKASDLMLSAYHPKGTCWMGIDSQTSVTDGFGAVHGVDGLFVADASIIPSPIHVNPQVTIMALALRVARQIQERWRRS